MAWLDVILFVVFAIVGAVAWGRLHRRASRTAELATARGELADELILSAEQERRDLAGAIHDGPVQQLMLARASLTSASDPATAVAADLESAGVAIDEAIDQLRGRMQDLHSHVLEFAGLQAALEVEARRAAPAGMSMQVTVDPAAIGFRDALLFAVARELLINAVRHAKGTRVGVVIARAGDSLELRVHDDGRGFDDERRLASLRAGHVGLASCVHRVEAVGGSFVVRSSARGSEIVVTVPVRQRAPASASAPRSSLSAQRA